MNALCVGLNGSFCAVSESLTRPGGDGEARTRGGFVPPSDDIEEVTQLVCPHVCVCTSLCVCLCVCELLCFTDLPFPPPLATGEGHLGRP